MYKLTLLILAFFHPKVQDISFSFFDGQTGKAIQVETFLLQNEIKTYIFKKKYPNYQSRKLPCCLNCTLI